MTDIFKQAEQTLKELEQESEKRQKAFWDKLHALETKKVNVDDELLKEWLEEYWLLYRNPENSDEWFVAVPKFLDFSIGWLDHTTKGYNIFVINKYTQWLGEDFFRTEKTFREVCNELEKRGLTAIRQKNASIFSKLNNLVKTKKLFKDTRNGKKVFVMR